MTLVEGTDSAGGYLTRAAYDKVQEMIYEYGLARKIIPIMRLDTDKIDLPNSDSSGVTAYFVSEAGTVTASEPTFSQTTVTMKKLRVKVPMSQELIDDAEEDVESYVLKMMANAIALKEDTAIFKDGGVSGSGITSIIDTTGITTQDLDGAYLSPDHISKAISTLETNGANMNRLVLVVHPLTAHYLRTLKDNNNNYLFNTLNAGNPILKTGAIGQIMGVPVYTTPVFGTATETVTAGDKTCTDALLFDTGAMTLFMRKSMYKERDKDYDTDVWNIYLTERMSFNVRHPKGVYHFDKVLVE